MGDSGEETIGGRCPGVRLFEKSAVRVEDEVKITAEAKQDDKPIPKLRYPVFTGCLLSSGSIKVATLGSLPESMPGTIS